MNKLSLICLLFFLVFANVFANKSTTMNEKQKELAIFYYEVGQRYKDVGKTKKGQEFQDKALKIYPNLTKEVDLEVAKAQIDAEINANSKSGAIAFEDVKLDDIPGITHEKIEISDITNAPKIEYIAEDARKKNQDKVIKFQFDKFARALVSKNGELLDSIIDEEIEINGQGEDKEDFIQDFAESSSNIATEDLEYLSIDDFYDLSSLKVQKKDENSYNIKVLAKVNNITKKFSFWNSNQTLVFNKKGDKWLLSSIK